MKILVVGAGATGGYFGGRLAQAGRDVTFLVRPRRAAQLKERGLRIVGLGEEEQITPQLVTAQELVRHYDLVLLTVKATGLEQALTDIAPAVGASTSIVPFLNGMRHLELLNARFGRQSILGGVVKIAADLNAEQDVVRLGPGASLDIGEQDGESTLRLQVLESTLRVNGFELGVPKNIIEAMWHKWVFIATLGATVTLMRGSIGDIVAVPGGAQLGPAIGAEAAAIAAAAGFPVPERALALLNGMTTRAGAPTTSSLYRDVVAGRPAESEQIVGDLTTQARALSVATPLLDLAALHLRVHEHRLRTRAGVLQP